MGVDFHTEPFQVHATQEDHWGNKYYVLPSGSDDEARVLATMVDILQDALRERYPTHGAWARELKDLRLWIGALTDNAMVEDDGKTTYYALQALGGLVRLFAQADGFPTEEG